MSTRPYEYHGTGDPTAAPAALGLGLLAVGGWLLTTARPWHKPGNALTLGLGWSASGALLLCGLVLLARCVRTVHGVTDAQPRTAADRAGEPPARPTGSC
ncbi:hypothetical protein AMK16_11935 [Streptomyces sp. CB00455]|uniref:hypothetical protein n=1 Tax=Streptomyces sp. CB00455 TaxID=1703927 RepID=UPI00093BF4C4|nr:hypothetical protein [Streptomyces sp. CB00455]OKK21074.1 hypothetical protein AMK16_11935 [Streptomyces sp. CB00455]